MAGHIQSTPRGIVGYKSVNVGAHALTGNSTGTILPAALYLSGKTDTKLTANTTGLVASGTVSAAGAFLPSGKTVTLTANTTGLISSGALYASGATGSKLTGNSTGVIAAGAVTVSGQATAGKLTANSTAVILPALKIGALDSYITVDTTGVKLGARYLSTNTTGNSAT